MWIHHVSVEHFRGIEHADITFADGVICLIGPGDSTCVASDGIGHSRIVSERVDWPSL